jgi:hypothetical protein
LQHAAEYFVLGALDVELQQVQPGVSEFFHQTGNRPAVCFKVIGGSVKVDDRMRHVTTIRGGIESESLVRRPQTDLVERELRG